MVKKRSLVYIINSLQIGGAEIGMCRLLDGIDQERYDVTVVSLDGQEDDLVAQIPSWVEIIDLNLRSKPNLSGGIRFHKRAKNADFIIGSLFHAASVARILGLILGKAVIATWRHRSIFDTPTREKIFRRTANLNDIILADSDAVAEILRTEFDINYVHTVPIAGIELEEYEQVNHEDSDSKITVGTVGRLESSKNYPMVLDVAAEFQEKGISFEIAGDGELYENIETQITHGGLQNVTLHGQVTDIPEFLSGVDIYFQPSLQEGLCITVLEAMAAGLPIVGSDVGGIGQNVEQGTSGLLYEPTDSEGFVSGIEQLANDPQLRQQFGERGREIVANKFTQEVLVSEFENALERGRKRS